MNDLEEGIRDRLAQLNPLRCAICGGQDGVLIQDDPPTADAEAYVHPYCKRLYKLKEEK